MVCCLAAISSYLLFQLVELLIFSIISGQLLNFQLACSLCIRMGVFYQYSASILQVLESIDVLVKKIFNEMLVSSFSVIIIVGETGSGKTTQ